MNLHGCECSTGDLVHMAAQKTRERLRLNAVTLSGTVYLGGERFHQLADIGRVYEVVIDLVANSLKSGLKRGISGQDKVHAFGLSGPHSTDNREPISRLTDIQIGDQSIKLLRIDKLEGLC